MKKYFWTILISSFLIIPFASIINFFTNNTFKTSNDLKQIVEPSRGWPAKNFSQLKIWQFLYNDTQQKIVVTNDKMMDGFYSFYRDEYYKYRDTAEKNIGKPGYDEIGIPLDEINDYIEQKIVFSYDMQKFMALSLRSYFIELSINQIIDSSNNISPNEYLNLWVMKYFQAGFYFQWAKIWIQDLGRTIEKSVDVDFYVFGSLVPRDKDGNSLWWKGPDPVAAGKIKPQLKLDSVMTNMIDKVYTIVLGRGN
ncbi:hypothetical protein [Spiroplasma sp. SV19]|uniref:hypothetical protein n=1 Tax=Spiroplasma sp. SV19 TaxID=2570468 RepID=UPI0024B6CA99|nr:hypothetical protein [Spiroplasma sp. SV19]WHQ36917.1 hypothetical protein E7Y35_03325 [Spiroplasma sp. SV19]